MPGRSILRAQPPAAPIRSRRNLAAAEAVPAAVVAVELAAEEAEAADESHRAQEHLQDLFPGRDPGPRAQGRLARGRPWRIGCLYGRLRLGQEYADEHPRMSRSANL